MADWNVAKTAGVCCVSGRQLEEGEEFYCVLFEADDGFDRRDYAPEHWPGAPEDAFCFWKSKIPPKQKKKQTFVDDDVLLSFFSRLADEKDSMKENFRFVLALILMRKRILKYEATIREEGEEYWRMRQEKGESVHRVRNPRLNDEQIREVSAQLGQILHSDMGEFEALEVDEGVLEGTAEEAETASESFPVGDDHGESGTGGA